MSPKIVTMCRGLNNPSSDSSFLKPSTETNFWFKFKFLCPEQQCLPSPPNAQKTLLAQSRWFLKDWFQWNEKSRTIQLMLKVHFF